MNYKAKILPFFDCIVEMAAKHSVSESVINSVYMLKKETEAFKVLIPLLGTFNAGKSSLLNELLKQSILPTDIIPETSIAAELYYGKQDKIVAYKKNGGEQDFSLAEIKGISPQRYSYIKIYQDNEILKEFEDIVLVDMPGLDSAILEHNQAIVNYIQQGVYYIILADVEFGLKESVLNFLYELNAYNIDFSVLVSKIDHKLPEDAALVQNNVKAVVQSIVGKDVPVGKISTKLGDIEDFIKILRSINQTEVIIQNVEPKILTALDYVQKDLEIRLKYSSINTVEIDKKIRELERGIIEIEREISLQEQQIARKFSGETVEHVLHDVQQVLHENILSLVKAAKSGGDHLNREINALIRPTLIQSVDFNVTEVFSYSFEHVSDRMENLTASLAYVTTSLKEGSKQLSTFMEVIENPKFRAVVGGLALTTTVVAPWLELIIFFLPEIIKLFSNQEQQIQEQIEQQVIPEIIGKLRPEIKQNLVYLQEHFIEELRNTVEKERADLISSLEQTKEDKRLVEQEGQQVIKELQTSLHTLQEIRQEVLKERDVVELMG